MWGGWFSDPEFMENLSYFLKITEKSLNKNLCSVSEVAVFIDETSYAYISDGTDRFIYPVRHSLGLCGTPYDIYLTSDFNSVYKKYKFLVFLAPRTTALTENAVKRAGDIPYIVINAKNSDISSSQFREMFRSAGVHIYCDNDSVVYACESFIFVHTCEDGKLKINGAGEIKPVIPQGFNLNSEVTKFKSFLFEKQ